MIAIQSNEVKIRFSEVFRKVESGQEVGITCYGKSITKLLLCGTESNESSNKK